MTNGPGVTTRRAVTTLLPIALACLLAALTGCGTGDANSNASTSSTTEATAASGPDNSAALARDLTGVLGPTLTQGGAVFELKMTGLDGANPQSSIEWIDAPAVRTKSLANLSSLSASLEMAPLSTNRFDIGGYRYIEATFRVRNAPACAPSGGCAGYVSFRGNATFLAVMAPGTVDLTAFTMLKRADGADVMAGMARAMRPTNVPSPITGLVDPAKASLQVFRESELPAPASGVTSVFPYGFVVRHATDGTRILPSSPPVGRFDGVVTFAFRIPTQAVAANNPHSFAMRFQTADDFNTRVTQATNEQTFLGDRAAALRLTSLGGSTYLPDLVVMGGRVAQSTSGDPICRVRTAGTATTPLAFLVNQPASPVKVAAAPMNLESVGRNDSVSIGYCDTMLPPDASTLYVYGSQSGMRVDGAPYASGSITGGNFTSRPNQLIWKIAYPFLPGEQVTVIANNFNKNISGVPATPFVGNYRVKGSIAGSLGTLGAETRTEYLFGTTPVPGVGAPILADLNRDGKPDLILRLYSVGGFIVALGNGTGGFGPPVVTSVGALSSYWALAVVDINADGKLDVVAASSVSGTGNALVVLPGDGAGGFGAPVSTPMPSGTSSLYAGDLNGDGKFDLISLATDGASFSVRLGNGLGGFTAPIDYATSGIARPTWRSLALGDLNGDGKLDLVQVSGSTVLVRSGLGTGAFAAPVTYPTGAAAFTVALADVNGDGRPDILVARPNTLGYTAGDIAVLPGNAAGGFDAAIISGYRIQYASEIVPADMNGDGILDLVSFAHIGGAQVLIGDGAGSFVWTGVMGASSAPTPGGAVADLNGDGRLDVVITGPRTSVDGVAIVQLGL